MTLCVNLFTIYIFSLEVWLKHLFSILLWNSKSEISYSKNNSNMTILILDVEKWNLNLDKLTLFRKLNRVFNQVDKDLLGPYFVYEDN